MTRKKSNLWLHKTKCTRQHKKKQYPSTGWSEALMDVLFVKSSAKESHVIGKHTITPAKDLTPKRRKIRLFLTPEKITSPLKDEVFGGLEQINSNNDEQLPQLPEMDMEKENRFEEEDVFIYRRVISKLQAAGLDRDFKMFLTLVDEEKFSLDNLSFLLFLETVRFMSTKITSEMKYNETTKRFWKTGYKLFHAKFLYFMGGPRNIGQITSGLAQPGMLTSEKSKINFAVPSTNVISNFNISEVQIPKVVNPGVLEPVLKTLRESSSVNEYMLCADGKKITSGIDSKGGDVDMFGHEGGQTFTERKQKLNENLAIIKEIKERFQRFETYEYKSSDRGIEESIVSDLKKVLSLLSNTIKEGRELVLKQKFGLKKFKGMAGDNWKESRYVYVISGLQASLFQLREFMCDALDTIGSILSLCTYLERSKWPYIQNYHVDPSKQTNIAMLRDTTDNVIQVEPRFIKQRSELWHALRKRARVTGSTLHSAIGLRGLKDQKNHFSKFMEDIEVSFTSETESRLKHGVKHEINAVATIIGRFLPAFYPDAIFIEEGCYIIPGDTSDILGVVSPDGSIRSSLPEMNNPEQNVIAAIEIKCPFPSDKQTPVHYSLPEYYVCQCLAEMKVLKTDQLLYVSYSETSTTVLKVSFSTELWNMIWREAVDLYDKDTVTKPTKSRPHTKEIKDRIKDFVKTNVQMLCEIPSCKMSTDSDPTNVANNYFLKGEILNKTWYDDVVIERSDMITVMNRSNAVVESGYNLLRKKATEVMVWVITNKNRNSSLEIPCSVPIAYGLKDYKLTSELMRSATNQVLNECRENGLKILCFATDGQWIKLMSRDSKDKPLTIFQFQKDLWNSTKSLSKQELIKRIAEINKADPTAYFQTVNVLQVQYWKLEVSSTDCTFSHIATPNDKEVWLQKRKSRDNQENNSEAETEQITETSWLPETVLNNLANDDNSQIQIQSAINEVSLELMQSFEGTNETVSFSEENEGLDEENIDLNLFESDGTGESDINTNESSESIDSPAILQIIDTQLEQTDANQELSFPLVEIDDPLALTLFSNLKAKDLKSRTWVKCTVEKLKEMLSSLDGIKTLRHTDLNIVYNCLENYLEEKHKLFKVSWKKDQKVDFLAGIFGLSHFTIPKTRSARKKNPASLRKLAIQAISSKKYPKLVLRVAYTRFVFHSALKEWQERAPIKCNMPIKGTNEIIPFWFSYPEESEASGYLLCKSIDCSHNLTHLRVLTSTVGLCGISSEGWKECAKSNETVLTIPLVEDLIDKQSVSNARTHFSLQVENWMRDHGFSRAAELTKLIREWYEASDDPGIISVDRIRKLITMRKFLLNNVDFDRFPPTGRYFKGVPVVTFEGMLIDIDSKIQLHSLTDRYNIRSVGSLAAETTVGLLQTLYPNTHVSIKARDVPTLMSSVVEVMTCKANPKRGFQMRTSRTSGVYPDHEGDSSRNTQQTFNLPLKELQAIVPRDHEFDMPRRKKSKRRIKFGKVSGPMAPSKGALPVRQYHKTDESKILPTKRLGISSTVVDL